VPWVLAAALLLAACGDDEPAGETPAAPDAASEAPVEAGPEAVGEPAAELAPVAELAPAAVDSGELEPIIEIRELNDWYRVVLIDERAVADPRDLEAIGREICEGLAPCRAAMWYDAEAAPAGFPVDEVDLRAQVFGFGRTMDGAENILWNCNVFPQFEAERSCLPRPMN
jgi:hypothetical protein